MERNDKIWTGGRTGCQERKEKEADAFTTIYLPIRLTDTFLNN